MDHLSPARFFNMLRPMIKCVMQPLGVAVVISLLTLSDARSDALPQGRLIDLNIRSLTVKKGDMFEAMRLLRLNDPSKILIRFEQVPHFEGERDSNISLEIANKTLGEVLKLLMEIDPRYEYEVLADRLINVRPRGAKDNPESPLNIVVKHLVVDRFVWLIQVVSGISNFAPELNEYLTRKQQEYYI